MKINMNNKTKIGIAASILIGGVLALPLMFHTAKTQDEIEKEVLTKRLIELRSEQELRSMRHEVNDLEYAKRIDEANRSAAREAFKRIQERIKKLDEEKAEDEAAK